MTEYRIWWSNGSYGSTTDLESYLVWGRGVGFEPVSIEARDYTDWREVPIPSPEVKP